MRSSSRPFEPCPFALVRSYLGGDSYPCSARLLFDEDAVAHAEIGGPLSVYHLNGVSISPSSGLEYRIKKL